jgi:HAD superfamily hydrolase (TIGR01509 family)
MLTLTIHKKTQRRQMEMTKGGMIKGVFFDVGGTLYSYRNMQPTMVKLLEKLATRLALEHDSADLVRHYQLANREVDKHFSSKSFYLFHDYCHTIFTGFLERIGKSHLHDHADWFEQNHREMLIGSMELQDDCHETLDRLKGMGLYLSAVSNADANQLQPLVERGQLHQWLTHWTSSQEAQSCKPDKRFFEIALQKSGLTADQVLFVGDSLEQDIQGAHAIGMTTVFISETGQPAPMETGRETPKPDFSITRLSELPGIVESFGRRVASL